MNMRRVPQVTAAAGDAGSVAAAGISAARCAARLLLDFHGSLLFKRLIATRSRIM